MAVNHRFAAAVEMLEKRVIVHILPERSLNSAVQTGRMANQLIGKS
jgi:hypothetical protein